MINYRVQNIEGLVKNLEDNGVTIVNEIKEYEYGKFVHILDPEDNKIELSSAALSESNSFEVQYIKEPQTTRGTECDLPLFLEFLVVDYAVSQAKQQIEEYGDAQAIMQGFYQKIGAINSRYAGRHKLT